jgi:F-type H+-transporting ATPase subunit b
MSVDPMTFIAQVVNFAILVWLLNKVLYGPILSAIQQREERFLKRNSQLDELEKACSVLKEELDGEKLAFEESVERYHREALEEARAVKEKELGKARRDVNRVEQRWREGLAEQQELFLADLRRRTAESVIKIARRILSDLADEDRLRQLTINRFLKACQELEIEGDIIVRSASELEPDQRELLQERFEEASFEVDPDLILGLEIVHEGRRIGWSARAHLEAMHEELKTMVEQAAVA